MSTVIDIHTHAYPPALAAKAVAKVREYGVRAVTDGTVESLLASMERNGIEASVVCSIATRPGQFRTLLAWCRGIRAVRVIPFPSVHPDDPEALQQLGAVRAEGFRGVKLHPYYQGFDLDEPRLFPLYDRIQKEGLVLLMHTGYDLAFARVDRAGPQRVRNVVERFPALKFVTTHFGGWEDWERVEELLLGRSIYMDVSHSEEEIGDERARRFLARHPRECLLFGSDAPWSDPRRIRDWVRRLLPDEERLQALFDDNPRRLLGLADPVPGA
jgi:predicted TIM-barrel fold metal-dependent hydrolase